MIGMIRPIRAGKFFQFTPDGPHSTKGFSSMFCLWKVGSPLSAQFARLCL
jgi:hypothetical protein